MPAAAFGVEGNRAALDFGHVELAHLREHVLDRAFRQRSRLLEDDHLLAEDHQRRNRADPEVAGERLLLVGVDLDNPDVRFVKVNTDEEQALAGHFGIRSIPTLMIFREQVIVFQQPGALPKGAVQDVLGQVRNLDMAEVKRGAVPYEADGGEEPKA